MMLCLFVWLSVLTGVAVAHTRNTHKYKADLDDLWQTYKTQYNKEYGVTEEFYRHRIWEANVRYIEHHNIEYDLGLHTYTVGLNEYADLSPGEYQKYLLGFRPSPSNAALLGGELFKYKPTSDLPKNLDWRKHGYVTPIKNQGQCGSCWAFSSTGSLEGQHFRQTGRLVSLSEQNLVDCCDSYGNAGCNGGWMMNAFKYVRDNQGIDTESGYPYEAKDDSCRYHSSDRGAEDTGFVMIPQGDEKTLKAAVAHVGPVSVAIDAAHQSFQLYRSGVYNEPECGNSTDHAVLVVGYGVTNMTHDGKMMRSWRGIPRSENGQDYWLVKNSWGTTWGMEGYIMMSRNKNNQCAIASFACYPTL